MTKVATTKAKKNKTIWPFVLSIVSLFALVFLLYIAAFVLSSLNTMPWILFTAVIPIIVATLALVSNKGNRKYHLASSIIAITTLVLSSALLFFLIGSSIIWHT